jgi:hypothetical protein
MQFIADEIDLGVYEDLSFLTGISASPPENTESSSLTPNYDDGLGKQIC